MDKLTYKSRMEGYRARSVYKLKELNRRYGIIRKGDSVFDIGCWPGSWLQYCSELGCKVRGIDLLKVEGFDTIIGDILTSEVKGEYDVVLSDVAPKTSGVISLDQERSLELSKLAFVIARDILKRDGNFLCKVFNGKEVPGFLDEIKKKFSVAKLVRLDNSRKGSKEVYIVAMGYRKD